MISFQLFVDVIIECIVCVVDQFECYLKMCEDIGVNLLVLGFGFFGFGFNVVMVFIELKDWKECKGFIVVIEVQYVQVVMENGVDGMVMSLLLLVIEELGNFFGFVMCLQDCVNQGYVVFKVVEV